MPAGISGGVLVVMVLGAMAVYGTHAVVHKIGHIFHKTAKVATQPVRHPKKDLKAIAKLPQGK